MEHMQKSNIRAVHRKDLDTYLASLGIKEDIEAGRMRCGICSEKVTKENIGLIYPYKGDIKVSCNKPICHIKVLELTKH